MMFQGTNLNKHINSQNTLDNCMSAQTSVLSRAQGNVCCMIKFGLETGCIHITFFLQHVWAGKYSKIALILYF